MIHSFKIACPTILILAIGIGANPSYAGNDDERFFVRMPKNNETMILAPDGTKVCNGTPYINSNTGLEEIGKSIDNATCTGRSKSALPNCIQDGATGCVIVGGSDMVAVDTTDLAKKVKKGSVIAGVTGIFPSANALLDFDDTGSIDENESTTVFAPNGTPYEVIIKNLGTPITIARSNADVTTYNDPRYLIKGGFTVAGAGDAALGKNITLGHTINGVLGSLLPKLEFNWNFDIAQSFYYADPRSQTKWQKHAGAQTCSSPWMSPTRSDFNLAALVGGFTTPNNENGLPALLETNKVYSDGTLSAHKISYPSSIAGYTDANPEPTPLCVATSSAISANYTWNSVGEISGYALFQIQPEGQTKTTIFAVSSGATTPCSQINWPTPQDAVPFRAATTADLQFAIDTSGVAVPGVSGSKPLIFDQGYITADTAKKYKFTTEVEPVQELDTNTAATKTICVRHTDLN